MGLLREIFRCPNVQPCFENRELDHPCRRIVQEQSAQSIEDYMMPEPWMGNLATAPILFLGPNPKLGTGYEYPSLRDPDDEIQDFFNNHFGGGRKEWTKDGVRYITTEGKDYSNGYWTAVRDRTVELVRPNYATAGVTYALSEVVHCPTVGENKALREAIEECSSRYLRRIISESGAKVIVSMGKVAERTIKQLYRVGDELKTFGPIKVGTLMRWFAFLPHPSSWKPPLGYSFEGNLSPQELKQLRDCLK